MASRSRKSLRSTEEGPEASMDGRAARTTKTREAIVESLFQWVGEGTPMPTAQQVAERAGVGIRTVFRHFSDMESLYKEIDSRLRKEVAHRLKSAEPTGGLEERARELLRRRAKMFELIAPYKRATDILSWKSEFLSQQNRLIVREERANLLLWLPELESAPDDIKQAVELVTSFASWNRLRQDQRLSVDRARTSVETTLLLLLKELESK